MAHDLHFLSRLERVSGKALDLALGLYRDAPLLKWTFNRLALPDGVDVVALPLSGEPEPPHALVSRKGKFITCLAAGMRPGHDTARVTWTLLTAATQELEAWRALRADGRDRTDHVMRRMANAGPWLAREDFEDLLVISAVDSNSFVRHLKKLLDSVSSVRDTYRPPSNPRHAEMARKLYSLTWKCSWASSHAALVLVEAAARRNAFRPGEIPTEVLVAWAEVASIAHHMDGMWVRSGWSLGRLGTLVRPTLIEHAHEAIEEELRTGKHSPSSIQAGLAMYGLLAMAFRAPELRATVHEDLRTLLPASLTQLPFEHPRKLWNRGIGQGLITTMAVAAQMHLREVDEGPASPLGVTASQEELMRLGAVFLEGGRRTGDAQSPRRRAERPPLESAMQDEPAVPPPTIDSKILEVELFTVPPLCSYANIYTDMHLIADRMHTMPALAPREAEQHFFPEAWLVMLDEHYTLTTPIDVMKAHMEEDYRHRTEVQRAKRPATPGRNDACSCGSGQKYKRCCGK